MIQKIWNYFINENDDNGMKVGKDRKVKNVEEIKTWQISTYESRYEKRWNDYNNMKKRNKRGLKDERWWNDNNTSLIVDN